MKAVVFRMNPARVAGGRLGWPLGTAAGLLAVSLGWGCQLAGRASAAEPLAGAASIDSSLESLTPAELQVRYAESRLRLAELNLKRAQRANQFSPKAVGPREVERLARHVELTRRQVEIARKNPRTTVKQTTQAAAAIAVANARADLEAAQKANDRTTGDIKLAAMAELNVERLEAVLEMAKIHLELLNRPNYVPSLIDEMQWHIDQLTNEVIDLRHRLETGGTETFGNDRP